MAMIVQIDGTNRTNKGAELMFYAIAQELKNKGINCKIRYIGDEIPKGYFKISQDIIIPFIDSRLCRRMKLDKILRKFGIFRDLIAYSETDLLFDASGFAFSDQFNRTKSRADAFYRYLKRLKCFGTKIVFMPQALGPFEKKNSQIMLRAIAEFSDILCAREKLSYEYAIKGGVSKNKIFLYPDFTISVKGEIPLRYAHMKDYVTIIPNGNMISKGVIDKDSYLYYLVNIIKYVVGTGREVYVLNHEGKNDANLCSELHDLTGVMVVDKLNALETKGFISQSYLVVSSRYHGVASALNSSVPCLATSWSHKYELLFRDYGQDGCVLTLSDINAALKTVEKYLMPAYNSMVRKLLNEKIEINRVLVDEMWQNIWNRLNV